MSEGQKGLDDKNKFFAYLKIYIKAKKQKVKQMLQIVLKI